MNMEQTLARFVGNEAMLMKFLKRFADDGTYAQLLEAINADDSEAAFHQAHTLKGVAGNLGLGRLFDTVTPMVELLRAGEMDSAREHLSDLQSAYDQVMQVLPTLE
ncbi:Hpt domain-containing protein [Eubacteriales bacterium OttesenSCG-928-A19]|nr:Hpt domain-containing protein [Eubacteriales bacterium OttesenSCG-928-A19]